MKVSKAGSDITQKGLGRKKDTEAVSSVGSPLAVKEVEFSEQLAAFALHGVEGELAEIIISMDDFAQRLKQERTCHNLVEYKSLVKGFIERVVTALYQVEQFEPQRLSQKDKILVRVKKINAELEILAEEVLNRHKDAMTIADRLDGIRGLVLDLFI